MKKMVGILVGAALAGALMIGEYASNQPVFNAEHGKTFSTPNS